MKAPFPYFGGKSAVADVVWQALGNVGHYIEPFFGSGAVLLNRPHYDGETRMIESVNDLDGFVANVWRALQNNPDEVAKWCDWPVNHADLSARKRRLIANEARLLENLIADDGWYDAKLAGYWIWAASCWIGSGLTRIGKRPHVGNSGMGVHSIGQIPHVGHGGKGVHNIGKIPHVGHGGMGVQEPYKESVYVWFRELSERLRNVRVVCGDWSRVCGGDWQTNNGMCGMFFDPPYGHDAGRTNTLYHREDDCAAQVAKWCYERGSRKDYRIVLAGYDTEHAWLEQEGWRVFEWSAVGGYSVSDDDEESDSPNRGNRHRERLWLSPHCRTIESEKQISMF